MNGLPRDAVSRGGDGEGLCPSVRLPIDDEPTELALALKVDLDPLRVVSAIAPPARGRRVVEEAVGGMAGESARRAHERPRPHGAILDREVADRDAAAAARPGGERDLDRADVDERAPARGSPGDLDRAASGW